MTFTTICQNYLLRTDLSLQEQELLNSMQFIIALQVPNIVPNFKNIFYNRSFKIRIRNRTGSNPEQSILDHDCVTMETNVGKEARYE